MEKKKESINGTLKSVEKIFRGELEYTVPEYQRGYAWEKQHCEQLWDDLVAFWGESTTDKVNDEKGEEYFLGNIMLSENVKKGNNSYFVIDGQQRLVTLSLLLKVLQEAGDAHGVTLKEELEKRFSKGEKPRITFEAEQRKDDNEELQQILTSGSGDKSSNDNFRKNHQKFKEMIGAWYEGDEGAKKNGEQLKSLIKTLLNKVRLFCVECSSQHQALTIFETLNDRGILLKDEDIFKAKIYTAWLEDTRAKKKDIIQKWDNLKDHAELFEIYMYILQAKAKEEPTSSEIKKTQLRKFFVKTRQKIWEDYDEMIFHLESIYYIKQAGWDIPISINKWLQIVKCFPYIKYMKFPLFVFLYKNFIGPQEKDKPIEINIEEGSEIAEQFEELIKWTIRYFCIRGVNGKLAYSVRKTTYDVCRAIYRNESYQTTYKNSLKNDNVDHFDKFKKKVEEDWITIKYSNNLVIMGVALHPKQDDENFYTFLLKEKVHVEHILPWTIAKKDYKKHGNWNKESHEKYRGWQGNLIPCTENINEVVGNKPFSQKQEKYKQSHESLQVQEFWDLAHKKTSTWSPKEIEERDKKIRKRLFEFFLPVSYL